MGITFFFKGLLSTVMSSLAEDRFSKIRITVLEAGTRFIKRNNRGSVGAILLRQFSL